MEYISAQEAANRWGITKRRVQTLCSERRIPNASRIGNMWVVPAEAEKPMDARRQSKTVTRNQTTNLIKSARRSLYAISMSAFQIATKEVAIASESKKHVMALFTCELLEHVVNSNAKMRSIDITKIHKLFDLKAPLADTSLDIRNMFNDFLKTHPLCVDDALSWAYQYINKVSPNSGMENTQFFTEKYMISALVDQCNIESNNGKILDPACGGGNFLLYALDYLCSNTKSSHSKLFSDYVHMQLERIYGYEIDPDLAIVASINLRIKTLNVLKKHGYSVIHKDFFKYVPHIYYSVENKFEGALDTNTNSHKVFKAGTKQIETLSFVFASSEYIFTNPPFQTVKGMVENKKTFLNENYPYSKCDMCNAFIEFIMKTLSENGICGLVTQNSWMYLDSFKQFRLSLLQQCSIKTIIELGSNAFYDISGEKTNVVLFTAQKLQPNTDSLIATFSLKHLDQSEVESMLYSQKSIDKHRVLINQHEVKQRPYSQFSILSNDWSQYLQKKCSPYKDYATPMQGTSTGDSRTLVGYFWETIGNPDWRPVSKGGGFSRWLGLNNYTVKWGRDGEYIKETSGSAIRNVKYFDVTQLVFSDTGTSGLNVRMLRDDQIFIASGPGIRTTYGNTLAHIAFLNSRFSSYYLRLLSPKLTIAAGYISKIPAQMELFSSEVLEENARLCIKLKEDRLSKRPINLEYKHFSNVDHSTSLYDQALKWFYDDVESEWLQLCAENAIDREVLNIFGISNSETKHIDAVVGHHALDLPESKSISSIILDKSIYEVLSANCTLNRTRVNKAHLGCDGVIEYIAHKHKISPNQIYEKIKENPQNFYITIKKYREAFIHNLVLSTLGYSASSLPKNLPIKVDTLLNKIFTKYPCFSCELDVIEKWIKTNLTPFHQIAFLGVPIIMYSAERNSIESIRSRK